MEEQKFNAPRPPKKQNVPKGRNPQTVHKVEKIPLRTKKTNIEPAKKAKPQRRRVAASLVKPSDVVRVRGGVDRPMLVIIVLLLCIGSVMVFSASYAYASHKYGDSYYFIKRQLLFALIGLVAMFFAIRFDYRWIRHATVPVFIATSVLLVITPIYGIASGAATRWIIIAGVRFQPSELMKLALVLALAWYIARYQQYIVNYSDFVRSSLYGMVYPFGIVAFVCLLIFLESHYSCMIIMFLIGMSVIFAGGARKIWFVVGGLSAGVLGTFAISLSDYARKRVDVWFHPENYSELDEVWQTLQGTYAIGSGGLLGVGLGNSRQKHMFVSEPQNDFIFSIVCEELGMIGAIAVIALFVLFTWRGFSIALKAPDTFSSLVALGITSKTMIQAVLNICVVTGLLPNTGISLPFFSYGGTALTMLLGEMGILLCISRYSYEQNLK